MKGTAGDLRLAASRPWGKIAISSSGGRSPRPSNGRELFYRNGRQMMVVAVVAGPTFSIGTPPVLFEGDYVEEQPTKAPTTTTSLETAGVSS